MKKTIPLILGFLTVFGSNFAYADENKGDIAPYRRDVLTRIARNWHPGKANSEMTIQLALTKEGKLLNCTIEKSSGSKVEDKHALDSIKATTFNPLPGWYKKNTLELKIDLQKVEKK